MAHEYALNFLVDWERCELADSGGGVEKPTLIHRVVSRTLAAESAALPKTLDQLYL